jgi:hypothetical protein
MTAKEGSCHFNPAGSWARWTGRHGDVRRVGQDLAGHAGHPFEVVPDGADDVDSGVGVVHPVDRDLVDPQTGALGEQQQFGVEEPCLVLDSGEQGLDHLAPSRLESALGVGELGGHGGAQQEVVGAGDELPLWSADHRGAAVQPGTDGQVAVTGEQWRDQRQERLQAGGEVDVHVGDDVRLGLAPDLAQRAAAALEVEMDAAHLRELVGEPEGDLPGRVGGGVVGDGDLEAVGEGPLQVGVQPPDTGLQDVFLVVDRDDDLDQVVAGG